MRNLNYPFAGHAVDFLNLVTESNKLRLERRENVMKDSSHQFVCDMVILSFLFFNY